MHPVQPGALALGNEVGAADVGRQHGLLDQPVRLIAHAGDDLVDAAVVVADDLRFGGLEVHRAARVARGQQRAVDVVQVQQVGHALLEARRLGAPGVGQDGGHFGVGEAGVAAHHGRVELVGLHLALGGDHHVAHHAQALHVRVERAQAVGQLFRQHRDDTAREVHAGGAVVGIDVDGAAGLHIVAHVGNRHQQAPALGAADAGGHAVHGVVEVAGILAVDSDQRNVGQVHALALVLRPHLVRQRLGLRQAGLGKLMRHAVLAHGDLDFHARVVHLAQHFHHAPDGLAIQCGRLGQLDHHHLAGLGGAGRALGDEHVLAVALVLGRHQPDPAFLQQPPDDGLARPLDDFQHAALGPAAPVMAHRACAHPVLVQHGTHLVGRQEQVQAAMVGDDEAMPVPVALHRALDFIRGRILRSRWDRVFFLVIQCRSFLKCPGGGIGRRTSFRY